MPEKPCGLIAAIPPALQKGWAADFAPLVKRFRPAAIMLQNPALDDLNAVVSAALPFEIAVLLCGDLVTACNAGATGVYYPAAGAPVAKAREALGSGAVIGVFCGLSRHDAMESAEAGADFVAFDASTPARFAQAVDLSCWWDEVTGVTAALAFGSSLPGPEVLSKARPDFILIEEKGRAGESLTFATEFGLQSRV